MAREIERKFLPKNDAWRAQRGEGTPYRQGYVCATPTRTVRARVAGERAYVTIKGKVVGFSRDEFEYAIPREDAEQILATLCDRVIEKTRYVIEHDGHKWEVDEFHGANAGLVVAEIELQSEGEAFTRPAWVGDDVTDDGRYSNAALAQRPFSTW